MAILNFNGKSALYYQGAALSKVLHQGQELWAGTPPSIGDFYGTGAGSIILHLRPEAGSTPQTLTSLPNLGGEGPSYDASVVGGSLTVTNNLIDISSSGGRVNLANEMELADSYGTHLIWMARVSSTANTFPAILGGSDMYFRWNVTSSGPTNRHILRVGGVTKRWDTVAPMPEGFHLYELQVLPDGQQDLWIDGEFIPRLNTEPFMSILLGSLGHSDSTGAKAMDGQFGDIIGINLGAGSTTTIAFARNYLNDRYSLGLTF